MRIVIKKSMPLFFLLSAFIFLPPCFASDINLNVRHTATDKTATLVIENRSAVPVFIEKFYFTVAGRRAEQSVNDLILPMHARIFSCELPYPSFPGSYLLTGTVRYRNDRATPTINSVSIVNYRKAALLDTPCAVQEAFIGNEGEITVTTALPDACSLILPEEIKVTAVRTAGDKKIFHVKNTLPQLKAACPIFAAIELLKEETHYAQVCPGKLYTAMQAAPFARGRIPSALIGLCAALFLTVSFYLIAFPQRTQPACAAALLKYAARLFFVCAAYYILKNADRWAAFLADAAGWETARRFFAILEGHFRSANYKYFFRYFADGYWTVCLLLAFPYLYFFHRRSSLETDKYVSYIKTLLSLGNVFRGKRPFWNVHSKLGMLTVFVKIFFIPYLVSWCINNTIHQYNLTRSFSWSVATVNTFFTALFIYIDTTVYSFGYVVEVNALKNQIKSVEPTLLGWLVCVWCYPPFNLFSFSPFDGLFFVRQEYPAWVVNVAVSLVTLSWGVFALASVSLGFKGSNLTNRGIVAKGPYRFVRHPAYAAKLIVWIIQGVFLGMYSVGIMLGFILIYVLRALTEERHLSLDETYREYKKKTRWMFIPGLV